METLPTRGAARLDYQVKVILKNQSAEPKFFSHRSSNQASCIKVWNGLDPDFQNIDAYEELNERVKHCHLLR